MFSNNNIFYMFYQFQYFHCKMLVHSGVCLEMSPSNNFNGNDLMVLFSWDWLPSIKKLSLTHFDQCSTSIPNVFRAYRCGTLVVNGLIRSLKLFASEVRLSKWLKSTTQLHSGTRLHLADSLILLRLFPVKLEIHLSSEALAKSVSH